MATYYWNGNVNSNWNLHSNWSDPVVPTSGDSVVIGAQTFNPSAAPYIDGYAVTIFRMLLQGWGEASNWGLVVTGGGSLTVTDDTEIHLTGDLYVQANSSFTTQDLDTDGFVANTGTMTVTRLLNQGEFHNGVGGVVYGDVYNNGYFRDYGSVYEVASTEWYFNWGNMIFNGVQINGTLYNDYDGSLSGSIDNNGTLISYENIHGDVVNDGQMRLDGALSGTLLNRGTINASANIGNLTNQAHFFGEGRVYGDFVSEDIGLVAGGPVVRIDDFDGTSVGTDPQGRPINGPDASGFGRLTIDGNLTASGTKFVLEIGAGGLHDQINVGGYAEIGGTLEIRSNGGYQFAPGEVVTLISLAGSGTLSASLNISFVGAQSSDFSYFAAALAGTNDLVFGSLNSSATGGIAVLDQSQASVAAVAVIDTAGAVTGVTGGIFSTNQFYQAINVDTFIGTGFDDIFVALETDPAPVGGFRAVTLDGRGGNDILEGGSADDLLIGGAGEDQLRGANGDDELDGGVDADSMAGGAGDDTFYVDAAGDIVTEATGQGTQDKVVARATYTLTAGAEVELMTTSSSGATDALNLTGNALHQEIVGNEGLNTLKDGGGAADALKGLGGNDTYLVYAAGTTVAEGSTDGTDRVLAAVDFALSSGQYVEALATTNGSGTSGIDLTGNTLAQSITGNAGANILSDGGKGAADTMTGLGGNDTYRVYNSGDVIVETATQGAADKVAAAVDYTLGTGVHVEAMTTNGLTGTSGIDLTGNELVQSITGNAGDNRLEGKGGSDTLRGLGGKDSFVFASTIGAANVDTIVDFNVADDRFLLSDAIFKALTPGLLSANAFQASTTGLAADADDRIVYETDTGKLFYDADGNGAGAAIQFAKLSAGLALTNADFSVA